MEIKLIVTDLDGTLLNSKKSISEETVLAIQNAKRVGVYFAFATARPERNTLEYVEMVNPDSIISNNGAKVSINKKAIRTVCIDPNDAKTMITRLLQIDGIRLSLDYDHISVTNCEDYLSWGNWGAVYSDFSSINYEGIQKIAIESMDISLLSNIDFGHYDCHFYANQGEKWYMVTKKHASKYNAIQFLAEYYNIDISNVAVFGDDYNDIEMIENCGAGIAMDNSIQELKDVADFVCAKNDDSGVAQWITKYIL